MLPDLIKSLDWHIETKVEESINKKTLDIVKDIHEKIEEFGYQWKLVDSFYFDDDTNMLNVLYTNGESEEIEEIKLPSNGKDWKDYILTKEDKKEIAWEIAVPIVEKVIEKREIIKEVPIITNEIKEVAKYETPKDIVKKIESLEWQERLSAKAIKWLEEFMVEWPRAGATNLTSLSDTNIVNPTNWQILVYNQWRSQRQNENNSGWGWGTRWSITGTLSDQTDLQDALDEKLNVTDLSSNLTLYATNVASDISWYSKLVSNIEDPDYNDVGWWPISRAVVKYSLTTCR